MFRTLRRGFEIFYTCDFPVCRDCIVLCHQNLKSVTLSDERKQMEEILKYSWIHWTKKLKILTNGKERVVSSLDKFEEGVKDVKQNLEKQSNAIIKNIMDYKKRLKRNLISLLNQNKIFYSKKRKQYIMKKNCLTKHLCFVVTFFQCRRDIEILSMKKWNEGPFVKIRVFKYHRHLQNWTDCYTSHSVLQKQEMFWIVNKNGWE